MTKATKKERIILANGLPKCVEENCFNSGQHTGYRRKDGTVIYRNHCSGHHALRYNMEGGYKVFKRQFCENMDGRLGFVCTTSTHDPCMLDVDHIDHNHNNNTEANLQTLCSACHNYKTKYYDYLTPKSIKRLLKRHKEFFKENPSKLLNDRSMRYRKLALAKHRMTSRKGKVKCTSTH